LQYAQGLLMSGSKKKVCWCPISCPRANSKSGYHTATPRTDLLSCWGTDAPKANITLLDASQSYLVAIQVEKKSTSLSLSCCYSCHTPSFSAICALLEPDESNK
jgi:hypothetical protein